MSADERRLAIAELAFASGVELLRLAHRGFTGSDYTPAEEKSIHDATNAHAVRLAAAAEAKAAAEGR